MKAKENLKANILLNSTVFTVLKLLTPREEKKIRTFPVLMKLVSFSFLLKIFLLEFSLRLETFLDKFHK